MASSSSRDCQVAPLDQDGGAAPERPKQPKRMRLADAAEDMDRVENNELRVVIRPDIEHAKPSFMEVASATRARLEDTLSTWPGQPTQEQKGALLVLAMALDSEIIWDPKSDVLLARIVGALSLGLLRAHSDAVRRYENGAWRRNDTLPGEPCDDHGEVAEHCSVPLRGHR